jgi:hypothetical protein
MRYSRLGQAADRRRVLIVAYTFEAAVPCANRDPVAKAKRSTVIARAADPARDVRPRERG